MSEPTAAGSSTTSSPDLKVGPETLPSGRLAYRVNGRHFEIPPTLRLLKVIGYGAYGMVCSATYAANPKVRVAIKKVQNVFRDLGDAKRVLREVKMQMFFNHENVLGLIGFYVGGPSEDFQDVYLVSEQLDSDLGTVIRSRQTITEEHIKYFAYQILRGLKYMHSAHIMHRDMKPANLLVNVNCDLRICDYGLSRQFEEADVDPFTDYVVTRWYRPPELLLMNKRYTTAVDVWSVGCIVAEMANRRPLFQGKDYIAQLNLICQRLGTPEPDELGFLENKDALQYMLKSMPSHRREPMDQIVPTLSPEGCDFLDHMLQFDPQKRWTAAQLLQHPYLAALHDPSDEPDAPRPFTWNPQKDDLTKEQLQRFFFDEALNHPNFLSTDDLVIGAAQLTRPESRSKQQVPSSNAVAAAQGNDRCIPPAR